MQVEVPWLDFHSLEIYSEINVDEMICRLGIASNGLVREDGWVVDEMDMTALGTIVDVGVIGQWIFNDILSTFEYVLIGFPS